MDTPTKDQNDGAEPWSILMEAPFDSPLNMAHTYSRKAEMLAKKNKYEEAISCHGKAAECVLQVMVSCKCPSILESLQLQHRSYLSQMDHLATKLRLLDMVEGSHTPTTVSRATQTDNLQSMNITEDSSKMNEEFVYQIIRENDDMINSVCQKPVEKVENGNATERLSPLVKSPSDSACDDKKRAGWTVLRYTSLFPDKSEVKLEDVLKMNEKLGQCVKGLLQELSSTHAEKKKIEEKLSGSGDSFSAVDECGLKFSSLELPPLENFYPEVGHFSP